MLKGIIICYETRCVYICIADPAGLMNFEVYCKHELFVYVVTERLEGLKDMSINIYREGCGLF